MEKLFYCFHAWERLARGLFPDIHFTIFYYLGSYRLLQPRCKGFWLLHELAQDLEIISVMLIFQACIMQDLCGHEDSNQIEKIDVVARKCALKGGSIKPCEWCPGCSEEPRKLMIPKGKVYQGKWQVANGACQRQKLYEIRSARPSQSFRTHNLTALNFVQSYRT